MSVVLIQGPFSKPKTDFCQKVTHVLKNFWKAKLIVEY